MFVSTVVFCLCGLEDYRYHNKIMRQLLGRHGDYKTC